MTRRPDTTFEVTYRRSYARLVGQVALVTGNLHAAQDAVQEALYRAWNRWDKVSVLEDPEGWIRRVAFNEATSNWRKIRRLVAVRESDLQDEVAPEIAPQDLDLLDALRRIPTRQREAIVLFYLIGLPLEGVAAQMRVKLGTAKSLVSRGRQALHRIMTETIDRGESRVLQ